MVDREIEAMSAVAAALADLDEMVQGRILRWAAERYGVVTPAGSGYGDGNSSAVINRRGSEDMSDEEIAAEAPIFEHFAELFAMAQPKTDADKALVAAYWLQTIGGDDTWQAAAVQKELKNLGHVVGNVTDALTTNIRKRPQRILQLKKTGSSRQARKTYKVTHEGLVYVQGMLSAGET